MKSVPVLDRFWAKVDVRGEDECWEWTGGRHPKGYGQLRVGRGAGRRMEKAHRLSAAIHFGMFDQRLHVLHRCDNPPCVNPAHLYLGTNADNMQDKVARGRHENTQKTHCPQGHPLAGGNLHINTAGARCCRACRRESSRAYQKRLLLHSC